MHFVLSSQRERYPMITLDTPLENLHWVSGESLQHVPRQLNFSFDAPGAFDWPDFLQPPSELPLFSLAMSEVLAAAGATNLEYVAATVTNTHDGEARPYRAANVIGLVPAMDREKSVFTPARRHPVIVRDIEQLVLNEAACAGRPLFRLAEYDLLIVISEEVARALRAARLRGLRVIEAADWDGFDT